MGYTALVRFVIAFKSNLFCMYISGTDNYYYKRRVFLYKALQGTIVLYRTTKTNNKNNKNATNSTTTNKQRGGQTTTNKQRPTNNGVDKQRTVTVAL